MHRFNTSMHPEPSAHLLLLHPHIIPPPHVSFHTFRQVIIKLDVSDRSNISDSLSGATNSAPRPLELISVRRQLFSQTRSAIHRRATPSNPKLKPVKAEKERKIPYIADTQSYSNTSVAYPSESCSQQYEYQHPQAVPSSCDLTEALTAPSHSPHPAPTTLLIRPHFGAPLSTTHHFHFQPGPEMLVYNMYLNLARYTPSQDSAAHDEV